MLRLIWNHLFRKAIAPLLLMLFIAQLCVGQETEAILDLLDEQERKVQQLESNSRGMQALLTDLEQSLQEREQLLLASAGQTEELEQTIATLTTRISELRATIAQQEELVALQTESLSQQESTIRDQRDTIDENSAVVQRLMETNTTLVGEAIMLRNEAAEIEKLANDLQLGLILGIIGSFVVGAGAGVLVGVLVAN